MPTFVLADTDPANEGEPIVAPVVQIRGSNVLRAVEGEHGIRAPLVENLL